MFRNILQNIHYLFFPYLPSTHSTVLALVVSSSSAPFSGRLHLIIICIQDTLYVYAYEECTVIFDIFLLSFVF